MPEDIIKEWLEGSTQFVEPERKKYFGKYRAIVVDNNDPDKSCRLKCLVPQLFGEYVLDWALPCLPYAGVDTGIIFIPEVGSNVWIEFEMGVLDYPIWTGCFIGKRKGKNVLPDEAKNSYIDSKIIKTKSGHTIEIFDNEEGGGISIMDNTGQCFILDTGGNKMEWTNGIQKINFDLLGESIIFSDTADSTANSIYFQNNKLDPTKDKYLAVECVNELNPALSSRILLWGKIGEEKLILDSGGSGIEINANLGIIKIATATNLFSLELNKDTGKVSLKSDASGTLEISGFGEIKIGDGSQGIARVGDSVQVDINLTDSNGDQVVGTATGTITSGSLITKG